ncbi:DUF1127 domain-containing protein [Lentibacter algarum]|uniref:DUF1127 domain-containing protein n=1 Tax=Lentibacter algarum TaxID=576131 RepID=UPI001C076C6D|nr:DUF1127 domain-containing protein [Lentibacter algarum]MBU2980769.1 DUF1127 domain-containing protein [Lentibacter algarum]
MTRALTNTHAIRATPAREVRSGWLSALLQTRKSRRALGALSAEQLRDIGLTQAQAKAESRRPAWDVPQYWCK